MYILVMSAHSIVWISVALGALRGMLVKNLKSTPLAGCVMPLIPMSIISQNVVKPGKSQ